MNRKASIQSTSSKQTSRPSARDMVEQVHCAIMRRRFHHLSFTLKSLLEELFRDRRVGRSQRQCVYSTVLRYVDAGLILPEFDDDDGQMHYWPSFDHAASEEQLAQWNEMKSEYTQKVRLSCSDSWPSPHTPEVSCGGAA